MSVSVISIDSIARFTRELASLHQSGVSLVQSLSSLEASTADLAIRSVITDLRTRVETGSSLSSALTHHPMVFDAIYVRVIHAGECADRLDRSLDALVRYQESAGRMRDRIRRFMACSLMILPSAVGVLLLLLTSGTHWLFLFGIAIVALLLIGPRVLTRAWGQRLFDTALLHSPLLGSVMNPVAIGHQTQRLHLMLEVEVPILEAIELVSHTAGNVVVRGAWVGAWERARSGASIAKSLEATGMFPASVSAMLEAGERTGHLLVVLNRASRLYLDLAEDALRRHLSILEPACIASTSVALGAALTILFPFR